MNETSLDTLYRKRLGTLCAIATLAILFATLWPFNPFPANRVSWLSGKNGIAFGKAGVVVSKTPLQADDAQATSSRTLELFLRPATTEDSYTILSFYVPNNPARLRVRQWTTILLVARDVLDRRNRPVEQTLDIGRKFHQAELLLLTVVFTPNATLAYIDGQLAEKSTNFVINPQELSGQIIIGNSPFNYAPWSGEIRGLAIYSKQLTPAEISDHYNAWTAGQAPHPTDLAGAMAYYAFNEGTGRTIHNAVSTGPDLEVPEHFAVLHKPMLRSVLDEFDPSWGYVDDVVRNIAGFVPVGFIFCAYFLLGRSRLHAIFCATLAGGALSFVVEILQVYIPPRGSGVTDIITNTLGSVLGAALARPQLVEALLCKLQEFADG
jgi:VanZ like family/Concanavalin A-like lectin/glucanases superfamily